MQHRVMASEAFGPGVNRAGCHRDIIFSHKTSIELLNSVATTGVSGQK